MPTRGKFIVLEGIDGSGKTTQGEMLAARLREWGVETYLTCEPTERPIGMLIRQYLSHQIQLSEETAAMLFAADRMDHLLNEDDGIAPMVEAGKTVLCDRYYFSSYAYHSLSVPLDWVVALNVKNAEILRPDLTVFIDVPPDVCLKRLKASRGNLERYEKDDSLRRVRANYMKAFDLLKDQEQIAIVDGTLAPDAVAQAVARHVAPVVGKSA